MTQERLTRLCQKIVTAVAKEAQGLMNDQPLSLARSLGIDMAQLWGMTGEQTAFNPYQILGLEPSTSDEEVKRHYRELLRKLHPDTSSIEGTNFLLQMVLTAFELIKRERNW